MNLAVVNNDVDNFIKILMSYVSNKNVIVLDNDDDDDNNNNDMKSSELESNDVSIEDMHKLKDLLQKGITLINKISNDKTKKEATKASVSLTGESETYLVLDEAQFNEPRGKFKATIAKGGLLLEGKQGNMFINWNKIARSACIPNFSTSKKEGEDILVFVLSESIKMNNKDITNFQWVLNKSDKKLIDACYGSTNINGTEASIIPKLMKNLTGKSVDVPRSELFSSKTKEKPYLLCYKGIQEGAVYPMKSGIIFIKPLLYIAYEDIAQVSAGRGGTQGVTRYVDLIIETADEKQYEFTNIERDDLPSLNIYVKNYLEERKRHENANIKRANDDENNNNNDDDDDSDDDDEDWNSNEEEEDDDDDGSGSDDDDNDNSKKHESDNDTVDEEVGKENTKPPQKEKVRKESKDQLNVSKKESRKNKSPKKKIIDITSAPFPKSVSGFVNLIAFYR